MLVLIKRFDNEFKNRLEKYKCAKRYHEPNVAECRKECDIFIDEIEQRLTHKQFIMGNTLSLVDFAILPFIRQFARVDKKNFNQAWLDNGEEFIFGAN